MTIRYAEDYNKESYTKEEALQLVEEAFRQGQVSMSLMMQEGGPITLERLSASWDEAPIRRDMHAVYCAECGAEIENGDCTSRVVDGEQRLFHRACAPPLTDEDCR